MTRATPPHQAKHNPCVLLVDDELDQLRLLQTILHDYGFNLKTAQNGEQALAHTAQQIPDLILMDIKMPEMDGLNACKALKARPSVAHVPVVFLTSLHEVSYKLQAFDAGGVDYLLKPVDPQEAIARVTLHLGQANITRNLTQRLQAYESHFGHLPATTQENATPAKQTDLVQAACDILLQNPLQPPSVEALAQQLNSNRDSLTSAFQAALGTSPIAWLREERLRQASQLLRETDKALKQIAYECGYANPANFNRAFRQRFALTPSQFRQKYGLLYF